MNRTWRHQALLDASIAGLLGLLAFAIGFGRSPLALKEPLGSGDLTYYYALINAQGWHGAISPHFGYPYGFDSSYFPVSDWIQLLSAQAISFATGTVFFGLNLTYALSFAAAAIFAWLASRLASMPRVLAILVAVAFTTIPSHWFRVEHIGLATIYSLPVSLSLAMIIFSGRLDGGREVTYPSRRAWVVIAIALGLIIAFSGLYYTFYGALLIVLAIVFRLSKAPGVRNWSVNLLPLVALGGGTLIAMSPGIITRLTSNVGVGYERPIYDAVLYSGQLIDAILPTTVSMMPLLGKLAQPLAGVNDWANEANTFGVRWIADQGTTLTLLAAGALVLWIAIWGAAGRVPHDAALSEPERGVVQRIRPTLVFLTTAAALTAATFVPFGLGTYFATAVTLSFRGWDRMIVLFQLLLLVSLGLIASLLLLRLRASQRTWALGVAVVVAVGSIMLDTVLPARSFYDAQILKGQERIHAASMVVSELGTAVPSDCAILQLPYQQFPEAAPLERLGVYEPLWLGLVDQSHAWSYGGVYGSAQDLWLQRVTADPVANLGDLKSKGFCGLLVDERGYDQAGLDRIATTLNSALGQPTVAQGTEPVRIYRIP